MFRKCIDCGLEAIVERQLIFFCDDANMKYGKQNMCKGCKRDRDRVRYNPEERMRKDILLIMRS